jgi:hypothetical protein
LDDFADRLRVWVRRHVASWKWAEARESGLSGLFLTITEIDITARLGRLYREDATRVSFFRRSINDVARPDPGSSRGGVIEHVGAIPAVRAETKVVDVRRGTVFEYGDQLVLRSIKTALAGIGLVPDQKVFPAGVDR